MCIGLIEAMVHQSAYCGDVQVGACQRNPLSRTLSNISILSFTLLGFTESQLVHGQVYVGQITGFKAFCGQDVGFAISEIHL